MNANARRGRRSCARDECGGHGRDAGGGAWLGKASELKHFKEPTAESLERVQAIIDEAFGRDTKAAIERDSIKSNPIMRGLVDERTQ